MRVVEGCNLKAFNSYRLNARCSVAYFPENEEELAGLFQDGGANDRVLLGSGHNVILSKSDYEEEFVILNGTCDRIDINHEVMYAEAGAFSKAMSEAALQNSLTGLEVFWDIPSSLGGAVVMNAGAGGEDISQLLEVVRVLDVKSGEVLEILPEDLGYGYRTSTFQDVGNLIVLSAKLRLQPGDASTIKTKMEETRAARWLKQPRDMPNAGSVFKRPAGHYVGALIDELGLRGFHVGDAMISSKHGGFIVNGGGATGSDVLAVVEHVQREVLRAFGVMLEVEQRVL